MTVNPADALQARRARVEDAWRGLSGPSSLAGEPVAGPVVVAAGVPIPIDGTDQFHDFHAHPEFQYLSGVAEPGATLVWEADAGWRLFTPSLSIDDRVWMSEPPAPDRQAERTGIETDDFSALGAWLNARRGLPLALLGNRDIEQRGAEYGVDNWSALEVVVDEDATEHVGKALAERRRAKDALELSYMRRAVDAAVEGHLRAWRIARAGLTERAVQIELEAEFFRFGGQRTAYGSIVGSGPNSAILHGTPGDRVLNDGDLVLIDAGPEVHGYASDVSRTFPVAAAFTPLQRHLYDVVLTAQRAAIDAVRPGVEYKQLHLQASKTIAEGLVDAGILVGAADDLVASDAHALFFPHGLGHMLGLATHDCGGYLEGRVPEDRFGLAYLRADLPLEPGYVVTVEPGIYLIPALLTDPERRLRYREQVHWDRIDALLSSDAELGGIRIEDDVLVTADGCDVLSAALPSDADEIEALRREALSA